MILETEDNIDSPGILISQERFNLHLDGKTANVAVFENMKDDYKHLTCHICKRILSNRNNLKMHYRVHTGERPFKCTYCNYSATKGFNLRSHIKRKHMKPL